MDGTLIVSIAGIVVTAVLTLAAVVITPFGAWLVNKKWLGAPAFTLERYELSANTEIYAHSANKRARKRRKLGLSIEGIALSEIGELVEGSPEVVPAERVQANGGAWSDGAR